MRATIEGRKVALAADEPGMGGGAVASDQPTFGR